MKQAPRTRFLTLPCRQITEASIRGCNLIQAARRLATSGLCCSDARRVFFEVLAFIMDEDPHGLVVDLEALCLKLVRQALQRIVASLHPDEQPITPRADDLLGSIKPPALAGAALPVFLYRSIHLITVEATIPNRRATSWQLSPLSTNLTARLRISIG